MFYGTTTRSESRKMLIPTGNTYLNVNRRYIIIKNTNSCLNNVCRVKSDTLTLVISSYLELSTFYKVLLYCFYNVYKYTFIWKGLKGQMYSLTCKVHHDLILQR